MLVCVPYSPFMAKEIECQSIHSRLSPRVNNFSPTLQEYVRYQWFVGCIRLNPHVPKIWVSSWWLVNLHQSNTPRKTRNHHGETRVKHGDATCNLLALRYAFLEWSNISSFFGDKCDKYGWLVGGWATLPLWKMMEWVRQLGWLFHSIPKIWKVIQNSTVPVSTNQIWLPSGYLTVRHGKSPFIIGKPSISMGHLYH